MKKFFGFGSSTPPPPAAPPARPPAPPAPRPAAAPATPVKASPLTEARKATPPAAPSIVGRWKESGSSDTTEFHADGSVTEKTGNGETIRGRYSLADKQLKLNLEGVPDELSFPVALSPDKLEMTDDDGKTTHYERVS